MLICFCELGRFRLWFFLRRGCFVCGSCFVNLAVRLCFGIWVDVGVGFSFGGVVLSVVDFWDYLDAGLFMKVG